MKYGKTILVSFLILFTFIGNVGLSVFTHSCEEDGIFRSYIIKTQNHCEDVEIEKLPPCCQKEAEKSCGTEMDDNCCNDEINIFKINLDYFSQYEISIPPIPSANYITEDYYCFDAIKNIQYNSDLTIHPPPVLSGRQILIKHQVFRI